MRVGARFLAVALLGGTALGTGLVQTEASAPTSANEAVLLDVSIPAGPLAAALNELARQTGLHLVYDAELVRDRSTRGASGKLTSESALWSVLRGSGVTGRFAGREQVVLDIATSQIARQDDETTADGTTLLQRLVIYGSRETTSLADSSSSVGVVTAEDIENGQIRDTQDSFRRLANVMDAAFVSSGFVIRGMGSEGFTPAGAPLGSLYVDGVLQTRYGARFGARNLWDTEQVEVYRGPQSTLSGRAATAGSIYVKTKDPTFEREMVVSGTVGNREMRGGAFVINTPVVNDQIAIRIAGAFDTRVSEINYPNYANYNNLKDLRTEISGSIRAKLLLTPTDMPDTRALLTYAYSNDRPNERLIFANGQYTLDDDRGDGYTYGGIPLDTFAEYRQIKVHNVGLEVTHDFSDTLRLTSQTGFTYGTTGRLSVDAGEPGVPDGMRGTVADSLLSQEFRLNYKGDRWDWVAGVFGSHQNFDSKLSLISTPFFTNLDETFVRKTNNLALFGEATYEFAPSWFLTAGGRLDYLDEETREESDSIFVGAPQQFSNYNKFDEINFVPKIGISKELSEDHKVGFAYSEGFRTGGFYLDRDTGRNVNYGPERARNYELYYKGSMLDQRLLLNASMFFTQYANQQVEIAPDSTRPNYTIIANAASSRSWGIEIEPTYRVTEQFSAFASLGYLNTRFLEFNTAAYGDMAGEQFPDAPEWSFAFGGRYEFQNGFFVGGDAKYTSSYNARFGEGRPDRIDPRILVNAQVGFRKDHFEITAFAENLFDEKYLKFADRDAASVYGQRGPRRSFGLNVKAKF